MLNNYIDVPLEYVPTIKDALAEHILNVTKGEAEQVHEIYTYFKEVEELEL